MDGISDHLTYIIYCLCNIVSMYEMYVIEKAIVNINSSKVIYGRFTSAKVLIGSFIHFLNEKNLQFEYIFGTVLCSHAMETDSFLEYALPSHS